MLVGITAVGLALRVWGTSYGLPYLYHPDEPLGAMVALIMLKTGDLNPHFFGYGSLFFYLNALAYIPFYLIGQALGLWSTPADITNLQSLALGVGMSAMPTQIILGRWVSVVEGTMCSPLAYWIGSRWSGRATGLLAAGLVALSPTLVVHSQFITPNILSALMILFTLAALVRQTRQSRWPAYVLVGIALGAAIASKYNAALLLVSCGMTYFLLHGRAALRKPEAYLSLGVAGITFIALPP